MTDKRLFKVRHPLDDPGLHFVLSAGCETEAAETYWIKAGYDSVHQAAAELKEYSEDLYDVLEIEEVEWRDQA